MMPTGVIPISDPADPRIADYRAVRERDLVGRDGLFVAEGQVVLEKLAAAGRHPLRSVLVAEKRVAGLAPLLERLGDLPVYSAAQPVMDAIAGFPIHRGLLAVGERREPPLADVLAGLPRDGLVVGLVGIANHDNMGGLFRNAAAFGASAVLIDADCCDPLYRKAIRVSVGAALTTPFARAGSAHALVDALAEAGFSVVALSPSAQTPLIDFQPAPRTALLFGAEGPGLPDAILARCQTVGIAMAGGFDSLNVATTSGIVLHHLTARGRT